MFQIECPLCNKAWTSNDIETILEEFHDHLNKHTKEEVQVLKKLAELELKDPSAYQQLKESLMRLEYVMRVIDND
jgi:iron-sulfur cluster repair protein YtfE (RIC family)